LGSLTRPFQIERENEQVTVAVVLPEEPLNFSVPQPHEGSDGESGSPWLGNTSSESKITRPNGLLFPYQLREKIDLYLSQ